MVFSLDFSVQDPIALKVFRKTESAFMGFPPSHTPVRNSKLPPTTTNFLARHAYFLEGYRATLVCLSLLWLWLLLLLFPCACWSYCISCLFQCRSALHCKTKKVAGTSYAAFSRRHRDLYRRNFHGGVEKVLMTFVCSPCFPKRQKDQRSPKNDLRG